MQFKFAFLALIGVAFAQKDVFLANLNAIQSAVDGLDGGIAALQAGGNVAAATATLTGKATAVVDSINAAVAAISSAQPLDLIGASSIVGPADKLVKGTEKTIADLIGKKSVIAGAGQSSLVIAQLNKQLAAARKLADAIGDKVPAAAKTIAKTQSGKIGDALSKGIAAFS